MAAVLSLGLIASKFEDLLKDNVAIAFFIPVVAYIADSVGTQAEAIVVQAFARGRVRWHSYLVREALVGATLGLFIGLLGFAGAWLISHDISVALAVACALAVASSIASVLAAAIPIMFQMTGRDPALGSGPLSTALQDLLSIAIYFYFVVLFVD